MQVDIRSLHFPDGFHVGTTGLGTESARPTIPSDTLFSALLATWVRLGRDPEPWAQAFPRTHDGHTEDKAPPFLLSSTFPRVGEVLFYPKPLGYRPPELPEDEEKYWKRLLFVSEGVTARIRKNPERPGIWPRSGSPQEKPWLQGGLLLATPEEAAQLPTEVWKEEDVPRVTIDRVNSASNLFSVGKVKFSHECGLWFAVAWLDPDRDCGGMPFRVALDLALGELSAAGLGGDRSVGYGAFRVEVVDRGVRWETVQEGQPMVLLSRYHPRPAELPQVLAEAWAYGLEFLSGWGASGGAWFPAAGRLVSEGGVGDPEARGGGDGGPGGPCARGRR